MAKKKKKVSVKKKKPKKKTKKTKKKTKKSKKKKKSSGGLLLIVVVLVVLGVIVYSKLSRGVPVKNIKAQKLGEWGATGDKESRLNSPRGIAVSDDGNVYVSDLKNNRVVKYSDEGKFLMTWGAEGEKPGEFKEPSGVGVDKKGNVYVADAWNGRIQKFTPKGKFILQIGGKEAGFYSPRNVKPSGFNILFVADTGTSRLHRFDLKGNRLGAPVGGAGKGKDKFREVFGIAFDSKARVYVADAGNKRVVVLSPDMRPLGEIKVKGWEEHSPLWPMIAMDSKDRLYCVSSGGNNIWVYDVKAEEPSYLATIAYNKKGKPLLDGPIGIAIDSNDNVYLTEVSKNSVVKIRPVFPKIKK